jgi:hypothetical protein
VISENILLDSVGQEARDMLLARQSTFNNIKSNLQLAQERMKKQADKKRMESSEYWGYGLLKAAALQT